IWMAWDLMVIPRSLSRSILSNNCACISRSLTVLVCSSRRSAKVLFPWSIWAIIQKFLIFCMSILGAKIVNCHFFIVILRIKFYSGFLLTRDIFDLYTLKANPWNMGYNGSQQKPDNVSTVKRWQRNLESE